jgi:hypothetical protein
MISLLTMVGLAGLAALLGVWILALQRRLRRLVLERIETQHRLVLERIETRHRVARALARLTPSGPECSAGGCENHAVDVALAREALAPLVADAPLPPRSPDGHFIKA